LFAIYYGLGSFLEPILAAISDAKVIESALSMAEAAKEEMAA